MIELKPVIPVLQILLAVVVVVVASSWLYRRGPGRSRASLTLFALRMLAVGVVALIALNPVEVQQVSKPATKPPLIVMVDSSHSMSIEDVDSNSRFVAASRAVLNPSVRKSFATSSTPLYFDFAADANRREPESFLSAVKPNGDKTFIGDSLAHATASANPGAVLILSDGRDNGEISPIEIARQAHSRGFNIFTATVGKQTKVKDLAVVTSRSQVFSSPNQVVNLAADVSDSGYDDYTATVELFREGKTVAKKSLSLHAGAHSQISFPVQEKAKGAYRYAIAVDPAPGEVTTVNNRASSLLTVGNATAKVLVLEGRPTWDVKFLVQSLRADPGIVVDSVFKLTDDRSFAVQGIPDGSGVKVPTTREELAKYDVVMIGKGFEEFFNDQSVKLFKQYVADDGGHLVFLRGKASDQSNALSELEPVTWAESEVRDFRLKVTQEGKDNPAFGFRGMTDPNVVSNKLPNLISATKVSEEKAIAVVLARAEGSDNAKQPNREMAAIAYEKYGDGLVLSLVGEGLWRWALLPPDLGDYAHCYNDFWVQLVRWMVNESDFLPGQNLNLRTDHIAYSPGDSVNMMVYVRGTKPTSIPDIVVQDQFGKTETVKLSAAHGKDADFLGVFRPHSPGDYIATIKRDGKMGGQVSAQFSVYEHLLEDMNPSADPDLMARIALVGGGKPISLSEIEDLPRLIMNSVPATKKPEPKPIWDQWELLACILVLLSVEWFGRRRLGLV